MENQTHTPEQDNVIRKIQKLLALGQSPNEAEAALAMARAQELLAKHNLEFAVVTATAVAGGTVAPAEEKREKAKVSRSAQYRWQRDMWAAIAEANFCWHWITDVFEGKRGVGRMSKVPVKRHMILGRESNVIAVRLMGEYLEDTMERLLPFPNSERMSRAANSWKSGCAERLVERIQLQAEQRKADSDACKPTGATTALVLRDVYTSEYQANYDACYGAGHYAQRMLADAEWEAEREEREAQAVLDREKAEREWLEYLQAETPAQKKTRETKEAKERRANENRQARQYWTWDNERRKEAGRIDYSAYRSGRQVAETINLGAQVKEGNRKDRSLS
jgi:hypothetical protein